MYNRLNAFNLEKISIVILHKIYIYILLTFGDFKRITRWLDDNPCSIATLLEPVCSCYYGEHYYGLPRLIIKKYLEETNKKLKISLIE